jgi:hypothetical protein
MSIYFVIHVQSVYFRISAAKSRFVCRCHFYFVSFCFFSLHDVFAKVLGSLTFEACRNEIYDLFSTIEFTLAIDNLRARLIKQGNDIAKIKL